MIYKIKVNFNNGFIWHIYNNTYFKGFFWIDNKFYEGKDAIEYIEEQKDEILLKNILLKMNGSFCFIRQLKNRVLVAVDKMRSFPLYLGVKNNNDFIISDDVYYIADTLNSRINKLALLHMFTSRTTIGHDTLYNNIYALVAGEFLELSDEKGSCFEKYYNHTHHKKYKTKDIYIKELLQSTYNVFNRIVKSCDNRQVVIPLSAGYDSRYIAVMLKKLNYKNVICFSYGREKSFEAEESKRVAQILGYKWYFVKYDENFWKKYILKNNDIFFKYLAGGTSVPALQNIFAIVELKEKNIISDDAIVLFGHGGDVLAGSDYISYKKFQNRFENDVIKALLKIYFHHGKLKERFIFRTKEKIKDNFSNNNIEDNYEEYIRLHGDSKYILNSLRGVEYIDLVWRLPLWDDEFQYFWYSIDNKFRENKNFYKEFLNNYVFNEFSLEKKEEHINLVKKIVLNIKMPIYIYDILKKIYQYIYLNLKDKDKYIDFNNMTDFKKVVAQSINLDKLNHTTDYMVCWLYLKIIMKDRR